MMHKTCLAVTVPVPTTTLFISNQRMYAGQGYVLPACSGVSPSQYQFLQIFEPY